MAFNGYLLSLNGTQFPLSYMNWESYKVVPNRRTDLNSAQNANGELVRYVVEHTRSTIEFETRPMWNADVDAMMRLIRNAYSNELEKKVSITYFCPDINDYKTGDFYLSPNTEFQILKIENNKLKYKPIKLYFVEY